MTGEISMMSSAIPARVLRELSKRAADAPRRSEVFPVTILPSGSSIAAAGFPVSSAFLSAGSTTLRSVTLRFAFFIRTSIFIVSDSVASPFLRRHMIS